MTIPILFLSLALALPWRPVDGDTGRIDDLPALERLAEDFPDSANVHLRLLDAAYGAQDGEAGRFALGRLRAMGYAIDSESYAIIAPLVGETVAREAAARAAWNRQPIAASTVVADVPTWIRLAEAVAVDGAGRLLVGSIVDQGIFRKTGDAWRRAPVERLGGVYALRFDRERDRLYAASGNAENLAHPGDAFVGIVSLDPESLEERDRFPAPEGVDMIGDMAIANDGSLVVADSLGGGVYRLADGRWTALVEPGRIRSPQGIVLRDGRGYVADYRYGIAILDLQSGALERLEGGDGMALDGFDALLEDGPYLYGVQNGHRPARIVRLRLDAAGGRVEEYVTLERAHPDWGEPTGATLHDGSVIYVSRPQWGRFGTGGAIEGEGALERNPVRRLELPVD